MVHNQHHGGVLSDSLVYRIMKLTDGLDRMRVVHPVHARSVENQTKGPADFVIPSILWIVSDCLPVSSHK